MSEIKGSATFLVHGLFGLLLCKIYNFITDVTIAVSTLSLVLTSVDRFLAVVFPIKYHRISVKRRRLLISSTWLLAMVIHSPYFYTFRLNTRNGETFCTSNWEPVTFGYFFLSFSLFIFTFQAQFQAVVRALQYLISLLFFCRCVIA